MPDDLDTANAAIVKLTQDLESSKTSFNTLNTAHVSALEQSETFKTNLTTKEAELKTLTDTSKASTKSLDELQKQITEKDTAIATHAEALKDYESLKTSNAELQASTLASQKERLKAAGIGDELLADKDGAALTAMEAAVQAVVANGKPNGTVNGNGNGLTNTGSGEIPGGPLSALDTAAEDIKKAKARIGIK